MKQGYIDRQQINNAVKIASAYLNYFLTACWVISGEMTMLFINLRGLLPTCLKRTSVLKRVD